MSPQRLRGYFLSLSFRLMAVTIVVVLAVSGVVHVLWQKTAERNVNGIVTEFNREILQGVSVAALNISEDVAASHHLMRALFDQQFLSPRAPREVETFFLDLLRAKPLYTWVQAGFGNGDFWGANRTSDGRVRLVTRRWDAQRKKSLRTITHYRQDDSGLAVERVESGEEDYFAPARPWYQAALADPGKLTWSDVYLYASSRTPGIDSARALPGADGVPMVLAIGFELKHLSHYLGNLPVAAKGRVFIMNGKSQLLATSAPSLQASFTQESEQLHLTTLDEASDPLLVVARGAKNALGADAYAFHSYRAAAPSGERYFVTLQKTGYADWVLGTVIPENVFLEDIQRSQNLLLLLLAVFVVLAAGVAALMGKRWIVQPVAGLTGAAQRIERGDFESRVHLRGPDEFVQLGIAFDYMAASLKEREREKDIFGRVVSPEVREKLLTGQLQLGGETCWVSVIFSDIRGFSSLSETMSPQEVVSLLNEYMTEMSEAVKPWGGYINNFIGDAIVAVFGAPIAHEDVEWRAVAAALSMREHLRRLNQRRRGRGAPEIRSGIGISTGEAVAGQIGSLERLLYTVIGDAVNLAARLETMTKDFPQNPILMNGQTAQALHGRDGLRLVNHGMMPIKGRAGAVEVFSIDENAALPPLPE